MDQCLCGVVNMYYNDNDKLFKRSRTAIFVNTLQMKTQIHTKQKSDTLVKQLLSFQC